MIDNIKKVGCSETYLIFICKHHESYGGIGDLSYIGNNKENMLAFVEGIKGSYFDEIQIVDIKNRRMIIEASVKNTMFKFNKDEWKPLKSYGEGYELYDNI